MAGPVSQPRPSSTDRQQGDHQPALRHRIQRRPGPDLYRRRQQARADAAFGQSYSSYVLLPLFTFATRRKCLFVGGPGRGKTASAILMGVLAGASVRDVRRAMPLFGQHGVTVELLRGDDKTLQYTSDMEGDHS